METATGVADVREVVLVEIVDGADEGWGEAAPWPGQTPDSIDQVWDTLVGTGQRSSTARVALETARADLTARRAAISLAEGEPSAIPVSVAVGLLGEAELSMAIEHLLAMGIGHIKLKISPGRDVAQVEQARMVGPELTITVDANGSYPGADEVPDELVELDIAAIEQPLRPDADPAASAQLSSRLGIPIILDESIADEGDAARAIDLGLVPCIKTGRLGLSISRSVIASAAQAGAGVKLGGLFETSIGKATTMALAGEAAVRFIDLAPTGFHLIGDVIREPLRVESGHIMRPAAPGLGIEVDRAAVGRHLVRSGTIILDR